MAFFSEELYNLAAIKNRHKLTSNLLTYIGLVYLSITICVI